MSQPIHRAASYADIEALPPNVVGEILFGALVTHPRPSPRHGVVGVSLGAQLWAPFQGGHGGPGGWIFIDEPELHLGEHVAVPDLAGWRRATLPKFPETAWIETPPDWICEILSPATERYDRGPKRQIYAAAGVPHLWLVDPRPRLLEAFALSEGRWLLLAALRENEAVRVAPFEAISFPLGVLWPFDDPAGGDAAAGAD